MMEWWNIGKSKIPSLAGLFLKGNISIINSPVNPAHSGINKSIFQFPRTHYSSIPIGVKPLSSNERASKVGFG
jgi:hypothetical protein